jgi:hypothetical protein
MKSLSFRLTIIINAEPIVPILNCIFAKKYGKLQSEKLQEIMNSSFTVFKIFGYIWPHSKIFGLSVFCFD